MKTTPPALPPDPTRALQPTADPASLWLTGQYDDALRVLRSAVTGRQGLLALVGESGTGKTLLAHALATRLREDTVVIGRLLYPILEGMDVLAAVAEAFGLSVAFEDRDRFIEEFRRFVAETVAGARRVLLVVDEAQRLNREMLIELARLPYADGPDAAASLSVLLVGQRGLLDALRTEAVEPDVLCHLGPLTREQTAQYIAYRLGVIRHRGRLFTPSALRKIWAVSEGVPQVVNTLCVEAIGHRGATGRRSVTAAMVGRAPRAPEEVSVPEPVVAPIEAPRIERGARERPLLHSQRSPASRRRRLSLVGAACIVLVIVAIWAVKRSDRVPAFLAGPQATTASPVPDDVATDQVQSVAGSAEAALEASVAGHIAPPPPLPDRPERPASTVSRPRTAVPTAKSASVSDDGDGTGIIDWLLAKRRTGRVPGE